MFVSIDRISQFFQQNGITTRVSLGIAVDSLKNLKTIYMKNM